MNDITRQHGQHAPPAVPEKMYILQILKNRLPSKATYNFVRSRMLFQTIYCPIQVEIDQTK